MLAPPSGRYGTVRDNVPTARRLVGGGPDVQPERNGVGTYAGSPPMGTRRGDHRRGERVRGSVRWQQQVESGEAGGAAAAGHRHGAGAGVTSSGSDHRAGDA